MKKIEKLLKDTAQNDLDKEHENNRTLQDKILPRFYEQQKEREQVPQEIPVKEIAVKKPTPDKGLIAMISISIIVLITILIVIPLTVKEDSPYSGNHETKKVTVSELNGSLTNTGINGEFNTIVLTFDTKSEIKLFFTLNQEIIGDVLIQCDINIFVDQNYMPNIDNGFTHKLVHLGYEMQMKEEISQSTEGNVISYEIHIEAYMDTGRERYYLRYHETSSSDQSVFADYIQNLIFKK